MRESRSIKPTVRTSIPLRMVCLDTYSRENAEKSTALRHRKQFSSVSAYDYRLKGGEWERSSQLTTTDPAKFWCWLVNNLFAKYTTWVFGYRLGDQLTMLGFWEEITKGLFSLGSFVDEYTVDGEKKTVKGRGKLVTGDPPFFCYVRCQGKQVRFVDSCNYVDMTPEEIIDKMNLSFDGPMSENEVWTNEETQTKNSARAIYHMMHGLISQWQVDECGPWQPTAAMLSMISFRHEIDTSKPEDMIRLDEEGKASRWEELEQDCYYGGRITPYYRGNIIESGTIELADKHEERLPAPYVSGPIYLVDINALYPHVMSHYAFPVRRHRRFDICDIDQLHAIFRTGIGVAASVKLNTNTHTFPARRDGRVHYAKGNFWTALCGPELHSALKANAIERIGLVQTYTLGYPFKIWAENWLAVRKHHKLRGNECGYLYAKMLLNSLSGKWAQRSGTWQDQLNGPRVKDWGLYHTVDCDSGECRTYRYIAGHCQQWKEGGSPGHYFPILSAWIASYGRYYMDQIKDQMPEKSYLYQATDSLIVTQSGYDWLWKHGYIDDLKYGHFKLQDKGTWGEVHGPNHYQIEERMTQAGVADIAVKQPNGGWQATCRDRLDSTLSDNPHSVVVSRDVNLSWYNSFGHHGYDESGWLVPYEFGKVAEPNRDLAFAMD